METAVCLQLNMKYCIAIYFTNTLMGLSLISAHCRTFPSGRMLSFPWARWERNEVQVEMVDMPGDLPLRRPEHYDKDELVEILLAKEKIHMKLINIK